MGGGFQKVCKSKDQVKSLFFRLAKLTAAVLLAKDVPVYLFSRYVPTPFVVSVLYH